jgi:hypothetical protein
MALHPGPFTSNQSLIHFAVASTAFAASNPISFSLVNRCPAVALIHTARPFKAVNSILKYYTIGGPYVILGTNN